MQKMRIKTWSQPKPEISHLCSRNLIPKTFFFWWPFYAKNVVTFGCPNFSTKIRIKPKYKNRRGGGEGVFVFPIQLSKVRYLCLLVNNRTQDKKKDSNWRCPEHLSLKVPNAEFNFDLSVDSRHCLIDTLKSNLMLETHLPAMIRTHYFLFWH